MRRGAFGILVAAVTVMAATPAIASRPTADRPAAVRHVTLTFVDETRTTEDPDGARSAPDRTLVTEVWIPKDKGRHPLVVLGHGNAGHPLKLTQLLSSWAEAGYVVAAPAFPLTNDRSGGSSIIADYRQQPGDVSVTITRLLRADERRTSPLRGRIDRDRIGVAGFSLGGATLYGLAAEPCCRDRRIDATIFMDAIRLPFDGDRRPPVPGPVMFIHIDGDVATPYQGTVEQFDRATPPKYLMTLTEGVHFEPFEDAVSPHDDAVIAATTDFWDAYLKDRKGAARRIVTDGTDGQLSSVEAVRR
jgi:dienelactone hydrolase